MRQRIYYSENSHQSSPECPPSLGLKACTGNSVVSLITFKGFLGFLKTNFLSRDIYKMPSESMELGSEILELEQKGNGAPGGSVG